MIRREVLKQLIKFTHILEMNEEQGIGMIRRDVFKQLTRFTYELETDEEDRMG